MNIHVTETVQLIIEWTALGIELLAVTVIIAAVVSVAVHRGTVRYLFQFGEEIGSESYKHQLGKGLLVGLELLIAADVIRTVSLDPTIRNVAVLGLLVAVRAFLNWSLSTEIDRRLSWRPRARSERESAVSNGE